MKLLITLVLCAVSTIAQTDPKKANSVVYGFGGAIPHFIDGFGWKTSVTLVNLDPTVATFTASFFGNDGKPLKFSINGTDTQEITGTIPARGTFVMTTPGTKNDLSEGWINIETYGTIGGTAVFQRLGNEASESVETNLAAQLVLPFDHTDGYATGVAVVNPFSYTSITVFVTFRDDQGNQFLVDSFDLPAQAHTGITLTQRYPTTIGKRGTVTISTSALWLYVLGMRFSPSLLFSTVTPLSAVFW